MVSAFLAKKPLRVTSFKNETGPFFLSAAQFCESENGKTEKIANRICVRYWKACLPDSDF